MRIIFVQYGDYGEAVERFEAGGEETYFAQKYSVEYVARLNQELGPVTVVCLNANAYDKILSNGVHAIGMRIRETGGERRLRNLLTNLEPTHTIVATPLTGLLRWLSKRETRTLPLFADSFPRGGIRRYFDYRHLSRVLNTDSFPWVANHNINSSRDLARIGVDPVKIIPWDWPSSITPDGYAPKIKPGASPFKAIYVGHLSRAKGLGDCIEAIGLLRGSPEETCLTVLAGTSPSDEFATLARQCGAWELIHFITHRVPHPQVVALMHEHDAVLVPSRHEYPEGLPMTIYDALCARTPLIASDHPMFTGRIAHEQSALIFRAGDPASLANAIRRLQREPALYASLSQQSNRAWESLQCPVKWGDLISRWLRYDEGDRAWQLSHSLASSDYQ